MIKLLSILKKIITESRESDAILEKPEFLRKFLNGIVDGRYGESNLTHRDVYDFMDQVERDLAMGDSELLDRAIELYQTIRSSSDIEILRELIDLVKNKF